MNSVKSLKLASCKCIASFDIVEVLEPVADILPVEIVQLLLAELDEFQFGQFHSFVPKEANIENLFIRRYKNLYLETRLADCSIWDYDVNAN